MQTVIGGTRCRRVSPRDWALGSYRAPATVAPGPDRYPAFRCAPVRWDAGDVEVRGVLEEARDRGDGRDDPAVVQALHHRQPHGRALVGHPYDWFCH